MISPDFLSREIATACREWPAKYALVFHEREKRDVTEAYMASVRETGAGHALLSAEPLPLAASDWPIAEPTLAAELTPISTLPC